jgi:C-terminal processing protease CtpA/Prc
MKTFSVCVALVLVVLAAPGVEAQTRPERFSDPTTLVGPGSTIGVRLRELTAEEAKASPGVYIEEVLAGTPAQRAGMMKGDVVIEFDGERVRSVRAFIRLVSETPPERRVRAVVLRDGSRRMLDVTPEPGRAARSEAGLQAPHSN